MLTILGGLAEFERELIKVRTAEGRKRHRPEGYALARSSSSLAIKSLRPWREGKRGKP
jgi:DNA invertase Pin-like site-specific DNA recombinase